MMWPIEPFSVPPPYRNLLDIATTTANLLKYIMLMHIIYICYYFNNNTIVPSIISSNAAAAVRFSYLHISSRAKSGNAVRPALPFGRTTQKRFYHNNNIILYAYIVSRERVRASLFLCARALFDELAYVPGVCVCISAVWVCVRAKVVFLLRSCHWGGAPASSSSSSLVCSRGVVCGWT